MAPMKSSFPYYPQNKIPIVGLNLCIKLVFMYKNLFKIIFPGLFLFWHYRHRKKQVRWINGTWVGQPVWCKCLNSQLWSFYL